MNYMFYCCKNLSELNLSSFNTNNVTIMYRIFSFCENLNLVQINKLNIKIFEELIDVSKLKI